MGFPKSLMSSAVLAGIVFCSTTVPLAALNSKTVTVQVNEQPVLMGQLQDFAPPYLGFATLLSLGTGIVSLSALGWRQSTKQLESATDKTKSLEQKLQEQAYMIENLKFSDRRLVASGLDTFLSEGGHGVGQQVSGTPTPQTTQSSQPNVGTTISADLELSQEELEQVASFLYGKTSSGAEVSSVFKMPLVDDIVPAADSVKDEMPAEPQRQAVKAEPPAVQNNKAIAPPQDQEQLKALMGQLQQMMSQVEQLQVSQTPTQRVA